MGTYKELFVNDGNIGVSYEKIKKNIFQNPALLTFRTTNANEKKNDRID